MRRVAYNGTEESNLSENMEKFRHLDGNPAVIDQEFIKITFQHGDPNEVGINGCKIEDVLDVIVEKLLDFQGRDLACPENATALYHLDLAREALILRRRRREQQGLLGQRQKHAST
ncbi:hypothetical protein QPK87_10285 [Kamptonema cortianum]|nr:hypothetical protein [Geitlerinema splendidum]MDK3156964.1 hypothetical protein [Kamptonema cortianum]